MEYFIFPQSARFKDGSEIKEHVTKEINKVETILKNHHQSGHHTSGNERLQEICNSYLSPKGKNIDLAFFYAFLMLEEKDLHFVSCRLDEGVGASAGFGTTGGGVSVLQKKKRNAQEATAAEITDLKKTISDNVSL